jgi:hypothetical protein
VLGLLDERDAPRVAPALELALEERRNDRIRGLAIQAPARQRHDVRVVVRAGEPCFLGVVRVDGPHARDLVGDDRHADARAAHEHPELRVAVGDQPRSRARVPGVVGRLVRRRADVDDVVAARRELLLDVLFEVEAGVI